MSPRLTIRQFAKLETEDLRDLMCACAHLAVASYDPTKYSFAETLHAYFEEVMRFRAASSDFDAGQLTSLRTQTLNELVNYSEEHNARMPGDPLHDLPAGVKAVATTAGAMLHTPTAAQCLSVLNNAAQAANMSSFALYLNVTGNDHDPRIGRLVATYLTSGRHQRLHDAVQEAHHTLHTVDQS